jgi:hypothetical protein
MQARYYDPVIGRFYSNDPVDYLGHMQRGNPAHGFGRYTYANNNPYKYIDPNGEFGLLGFAIGFGVELASQAIAGEGYSLTKATVMGVSGALTGGLASIAKSSVTVGGKIVATGAEKLAATSLTVSGGAVLDGGAGAINASIEGKPSGQIMDASLESAIESVAPQVKAVGNIAGDITSSLLNMAGAGDGVTDLGSEAVSKVAERAVSDACSALNNEC